MRESVAGVNVPSADAMRAIGARLADAILAVGLEVPLVIGLSGELGAGKTTLVGGLLAQLGHPGPARSPTYSLIEPYRLADHDVYHCDLYRLKDPEELEDLGLRDLLLGPAILLVEWPERAGERLRPPDLQLALTYTDQGRQLALEPSSAAGQRVVAALRLDPT